MLYRTTDNERWGAGKEARLTKVEIDRNTWEIVTRLLALEQNPPQPANISEITLSGSQLTIYLSDGTKFGPYTIPIATMRFRGDWTAATNYYQLDLFRVVGDGLYMVVRDHTSFSVFDPNEASSAGPLYSLILPASAAVPTDFTSLTDTPSGFVNHGGKLVAVNDTETGLTFVPRITQETSFADSARLGTTANVDLTTGGLLVIDDIQTVADDRVLVKDQLDKAENGLYLVKDGAAWERTADAPTLADIEGTVIFVEEGTLNGQRMFVLSVEGTASEAETIPWSSITDKPTVFPPEAHTHLWGDITNKPTTFPPSAHTHSIGDVDGLQTALDIRIVSDGTVTATIALTQAEYDALTTKDPTTHYLITDA